MASIQSLDELRKMIGNDADDRIFIEYFMELITKEHVVDEITNIIHQHGTMEEIEAIV